jgi:hypothetical protein
MGVPAAVSGAGALGQASLVQAPLPLGRGVGGEGPEQLGRLLGLSGAAQQVGSGRGQQVVVSKGVAEPFEDGERLGEAVGEVAGDGPVQPDDRVAGDLRQRRVQPLDGVPVGVGEGRGAGVPGGDLGLEQIGPDGAAGPRGVVAGGQACLAQADLAAVPAPGARPPAGARSGRAALGGCSWPGRSAGRRWPRAGRRRWRSRGR